MVCQEFNKGKETNIFSKHKTSHPLQPPYHTSTFVLACLTFLLNYSSYIHAEISNKTNQSHEHVRKVVKAKEQHMNFFVKQHSIPSPLSKYAVHPLQEK